MRILRAAAIPLVALLTASAASAQTIDVAKISCKQFLIGDLVRRDYLALWLSGYYNGTRNDTVVQSNTVQQIADKVGAYCRANLDATLMDAVQTALGMAK
jgi:hypothetical protein